MEKEKIDRINELARKKKNEGLTDAEAFEQAELRREYLVEFRASFGGILQNTVVQYPDGSKKSLEELKNEKKK